MSVIIESGMITERFQDQPSCRRQYHMTFLSEKHLPEIMNLQQIIAENLGRSDLLALFSEAFMARHLKDQGFAAGIFVNRRLIAFRNVYYPDHDDQEWNLGIDINLAPPERSKVANLQMVCVHPNFRGNGLALKMNAVCLERLRKQATHHHICATVSPYNFWNIRVLLTCGFHIRAIKDKYGAKLRYVVYRNLQTPTTFSRQQRVHVPLDDITMQRKILNWRYCGVGIQKRETFDDMKTLDDISGHHIVFQQPVENMYGPEPIVIPDLWPRACRIPESTGPISNTIESHYVR